MNRERTLRIEKSKIDLSLNKAFYDSWVNQMSLEAKELGKLRKEIIIQVINDFKSCLKKIDSKKNINVKSFDIPYEVSSNFTTDIEIKDIYMSFDQKMKIVNHTLDALNIGIQKTIEILGKKKFSNFQTNNSTKSGIWWLDLIQSAFGIAQAYAEKDQAEETEVVRFETDVKNLIKKINNEVALIEHGIIPHINQLKDVIMQLTPRCLKSLEELILITDIFDIENYIHQTILVKARNLALAICDSSRIEILDSQHNISSNDKMYIIKCKKLFI